MEIVCQLEELVTNSLSGTQWICLDLWRGPWNRKVVARGEKPELDLEN